MHTSCSTFTHHDDSSRLLCCAHAHDGCHTNGGALEVDPTKGKKTEVSGAVEQC